MEDPEIRAWSRELKAMGGFTLEYWGSWTAAAAPTLCTTVLSRAVQSSCLTHEFMRNQCSRAPMLAGTTSSMLPLIASGLLGWSVSSPTTPNVAPNVLHDREHHYTEGTAMASLPPKEKGQPPTWSLAYWGLDELGSIEWRGMMAALIPSRYQTSKESERLAANRAASSRK